MGNSVAREFHHLPLGKSSRCGYNDDQALIAPTSLVPRKRTTIIVRQDHERGSLIFFDEDQMLPIYITSLTRKHPKGIESITKDRDGNVLFFTTKAPECRNKKLVYTEMTSDGDLPCTAEIDIDRSGSAVCAFLNVIIWKGSGPEPMAIYKAVKISEVKFGALVVDMEGKVVAKTFLDESRMQPIIECGSGADLACVIGITSALHKNFRET